MQRLKEDASQVETSLFSAAALKRTSNYIDDPDSGDSLSEELIEDQAWDWDAKKAEEILRQDGLAVTPDGQLDLVCTGVAPHPKSKADQEERLAAFYFLQKIAASERGFNSASNLVIPVKRGQRNQGLTMRSASTNSVMLRSYEYFRTGPYLK